MVSSNKEKEEKRHLHMLGELCASRCPELVVIQGTNGAVGFETSPM